MAFVSSPSAEVERVEGVTERELWIGDFCQNIERYIEANSVPKSRPISVDLTGDLKLAMTDMVDGGELGEATLVSDSG